MPGLDRTGPLGMGPMTGRGLGLCGRGRGVGRGGYGAWGYGRGFGRGLGLGRGRGWWGPGYGAAWVPWWGPGTAADPFSAELEDLRRENEELKKRLERLEREGR